MPAAPSPTRLDPASPLRGGEVVVRRATLIGCGVGAAFTIAWAGAASWYILARDDLSQGFFARQTEMRFAYEDRIGVLAGRLEREVTQNLVDRDTSEARLMALTARQGEIESRQSWLRGIAERVAGLGLGLGGGAAITTGSLSLLPQRSERPVPRPDLKPAPLAEPFALRLGDPATVQDAAKPTPRDRLSLIERSLDAVSSDEVWMAETWNRAVTTRLARMSGALDVTGLDVERRAPNPSLATGGPLVALPDAAKAGPFGHLAGQIEFGLTEIDRLTRTVRRLPLGRPLAGELEQTSPFGARVDPFTRGLAFHTGSDFRGEEGAPVRATGAGRVTSAEYTGGYGNMVEVDHGGGLATRYGHLSVFAVAPGDRVEAGQVVGRVGSTGRSTGNHVHYETRINGEPVNPTRFLDAGRLLDGLSG